MGKGDFLTSSKFYSREPSYLAGNYKSGQIKNTCTCMRNRSDGGQGRAGYTRWELLCGRRKVTFLLHAMAERLSHWPTPVAGLFCPST